MSRHVDLRRRSARNFRLGRPPLGSLSEAMSVAVWVAVLLALWVERQYGVKVLGAFVLPVVLVLSINSATTRPLGIPGIDPNDVIEFDFSAQVVLKP